MVHHFYKIDSDMIRGPFCVKNANYVLRHMTVPVAIAGHSILCLLEQKIFSTKVSVSTLLCVASAGGLSMFEKC